MDIVETGRRGLFFTGSGVLTHVVPAVMMTAASPLWVRVVSMVLVHNNTRMFHVRPIYYTRV
jgi:hypothetical protein